MNIALTPLELKVMTILWRLKKAFVKEIIEEWTETLKPAYNTISTVIRILENKGVVSYKAYGRTHQYYPKITKATYQKQFIKRTITDLFDGSLNALITTVVDNKKLSHEELNKLKELIDKAGK